MDTHNKVPFFKPGFALQSLRDSGHSLPTALGEPIDNSLEAGATRVLVLLEESTALNRPKKKRKHIHRVSIIDNGAGMPIDVLQRYLQLGFSTRYMSTTTIGKYGVGAKLAALNFARQIDVWSRTDASEPWLHVGLDLDEVIEADRLGQEVALGRPEQAEFPPELLEHVPDGTGTVVVWSKVDRLEEGRWAPDADALRVDVEKELSRIFRSYIRDGREIRVNDTLLLPHDPLFRMDETWADQVLTNALAAGSDDAKAGKKSRGSTHFPADVVTHREAIKVGESTAYLTVTVYPREVLRKRGMGGDSLAKKLRVPDNEGALSFVRLDREIAYTTVPKILPAGVEERDRFIGIEVVFSPELDEYFGVRNVKRGVEPHGELRELIREKLKVYIKTAREKIEEAWGVAARSAGDHRREHTAVTDAVGKVDHRLPPNKVEREATPDEAEEKRRELAEDAGITDKDEQTSYLDRIRNKPFVIESISFPGKEFLLTEHLGQQILIRMNTRHRFYKEMWAPIAALSEQSAGAVSGDEAVRIARRTKEALDLLVCAYAKAEAMHASPAEQYEDLRSYWGQFLDTLLNTVKNAG